MVPGKLSFENIPFHLNDQPDFEFPTVGASQSGDSSNHTEQQNVTRSRKVTVE